MTYLVIETEAEKLLKANLALSREQRERLRLAHNLAVVTANRKPTKGQKRQADEIVASVRRELQASLQDTIDLAQGRDETVIQPAHGPVTIVERDGLRSLHVAKSLSDAELFVGLAYRYAFETDRGQIGSCLAERLGSTTLGPVEIGYLRAIDAGFSSKVDRQVALRVRDEPAALTMLRSVAGEGKTVTCLASGSSRARDRYVRALKLALVVVAEHLGVSLTGRGSSA